MNKDVLTVNNHIYSNSNNILLEIINELQQIIKSNHDNLIIKRISDIIIKINFIINENKKNAQLIYEYITNLKNQMAKMNKNINNINIQEIKYGNKRYVGEVVNGLREGKGIVYFNDGHRYEGDFKNNKAERKGIEYYNDGDIYEGYYRNGKKEGKGIYYYNNGNIYEGDFRNGLREGKGIMYYHNGDRYEGDWRNDKKDGKGIYYWNNGNRVMGNFYKGNPKGKYVTLTKDGEIIINDY